MTCQTLTPAQARDAVALRKEMKASSSSRALAPV